MYTKKATNLEEYFNLPNPGLRAYLAHNVVGNSEVYRTPFWNKATPTSVLAGWKQVIENSDVPSLYPGLYEYELEMQGKVGPMSYQAPLKDRLSSVEMYYTAISRSSEPIDPRAIKLACDFFGNAGIRPRSIQSTVENMRLDTNSGAPYFGRRSTVVTKTLEKLDPNSWNVDVGYKPAAVLGWRGQEGGPSTKDVKQRVVWMMPLSVNIRELQLYQPLIEHIQKHMLVPAYVSNDAVDDAITKCFAWKEPESPVICTDFTAFDQHMNSHMSSAAEQVLQSMVTPSQSMLDWFTQVYPIKYNIPLVCSERVMFTGAHGMGSGSGGTNADETLVHKALQYEVALDADSTLCPFSQDLGDDGYLALDHGKRLSVDRVARAYCRHGQEMNKAKQYVSDRAVIYLRRWHDIDYRENGVMVGVYPTFRALGRLMYQERFYDPNVWNNKLVTLRAWSILENCNHHPCFEEFVDYVMKGDKYRLGLDIPGFINDIGAIANDATELLPDFLGYNQANMSQGKGIQEWRIYKYLKSKA